MRMLLMILAFVLPVLTISEPAVAQARSKKSQKKEVSKDKLPEKITKYIAANLPNGKITKAVKQKRNPDATWVVPVTIKSKHHTLVFNKSR